jgi:xanthine dehydrogenase small subunit
VKTDVNFILNDELISTEINPAVTVLDFLRNNKKLTGTKEGCREGDCGACTVIIGSLHKNIIVYKTVNSCLMPVADLNGKHLVTIEGLNQNRLNIIQSNMVDEGGTQCGFCTPGFIISITNYFLTNSNYNLNEAIEALSGNICRCTGYEGIKRAVGNIISKLEQENRDGKSQVEFLIKIGILPEYFLSVPGMIKKINKIKSGSTNTKTKAGKKYLVSGGTDLYVQKWEELYNSDINFISAKEDLKEIKITGKKIIIGGAVTIEEFRNSKIIQKYFPELKEYLKLFGSLPIRNRATIAGNIANASPIADGTNILIAFNTSVVLKGGKKRNIILKDFYLGYKKLDLKPGEYIEAIVIEAPPKKYYFNYEKVSRRIHLDIASVNSSVYIEEKKNIITKINLSAGGVAPIPLFLEKTCSFLTGKEIKIENVKKAAEIALTEISSISDARGSADYKSLLLRQLIFAHFLKLFPALNDEGVLQ